MREAIVESKKSLQIRIVFTCGCWTPGDVAGHLSCGD
jgi:hypothetical protein